MRARRATDMQTRAITQGDFHHIVSVIDQWWGGPTSALAHPLFFYEFGRHALIAEEEDGRMAGFLLGFVTGGDARVAYVHLVGIDPEFRRRGVGRTLYQEFTRQARGEGAVRIKAITTPGNQASVDFHKALGYSVELVADYAGPNRARYVFLRDL